MERFPDGSVNNNTSEDAEDQAHPPVPPDDQARSPGSEDEELFERVRSSNSRGSAEAVKAAPEQLFSNLSMGSGEAEFKFSGKRDPYEDHIGQSDQAGTASRATAATFTFPKQPTYRGFSSGPTMVAPQFPGVDGLPSGGAAFDGSSGLGLPPSLRPPDAQSAPASASAAAPQLKGTPVDVTGLVVPKLVPYYRLEHYTHSVVTLGGSDTEVSAVNTIDASLVAQGVVDTEFKPHKAKWKCCYAHDAVCVFFSVRLFSRTVENDYVVEFKRDHGDAQTFKGFFRATVAALHKAGMGAEGQPRPAQATFGAASSQSLMGLQVPSMSPAGLPSEDEVETYVKVLNDMVDSRRIDSVLEATRAMAAFSAQKEHRMAMHKCGVVDTLVKFLEEEGEKGMSGKFEVAAQIFASACLANLSEEPIVQSSLYNATDMLLGHVSNGVYSDRPIRREAARTLRNLAQDDEGADAMINRCGKAKLESWCVETLPSLEDASMLRDATIVQEKIQARWPMVN